MHNEKIQRTDATHLSRKMHSLKSSMHLRVLDGNGADIDLFQVTTDVLAKVANEGHGAHLSSARVKHKNIDTAP